MLFRLLRKLATWKVWFLIGLAWCTVFVLWFRAVEPPPTGYARDCIFHTSISIVMASVIFGLATVMLWVCHRFISKPAWKMLAPIIWCGAGWYRVKGVKGQTSTEDILEVTAESRKTARIKAELAGLVPVSLRFIRRSPVSMQYAGGKGWFATHTKVTWILLAFSIPAALFTAPWDDDWQKARAKARAVQTAFWSADHSVRTAPSGFRVAVDTSRLRRKPDGVELWSIAFKRSSLVGTFIQRMGQVGVPSQSGAADGHFNPYEAIKDEGEDKLDTLLREYPSLRVDLHTDALEDCRSESGMWAYLERRTKAMVDRYRFSRLDDSLSIPVTMLAQLPDILVFSILSMGGTALVRQTQSPVTPASEVN